MIRAEREGALAILTLDRPGKANALTREMLATLLSALAGVRDARAVILTGAGKVFSAGADLDELPGGLATDPLWEQVSGAVAALPGMTVCALNGSAVGGALGMVLASDIRISVPGARFFYPALRRGYLPQPSDPVRLAALVGHGRARMMVLGSGQMSAPEALAAGLVDRVCEPDALLETARSLVADALGAKPGLVEAIKALFPPAGPEAKP